MKSFGDEVRDLIVGGVGIEEQRVAEAVVERDALVDLPRIRRVELEIAPALRDRAAGRGFGESPGHVLQEKVGKDVAGRRPGPRRSPVAPQKREFWSEPLPIESSDFLFQLASTPAFMKCLPKTRV